MVLISILFSYSYTEATSILIIQTFLKNYRRRKKALAFPVHVWLGPREVKAKLPGPLIILLSYKDNGNSLLVGFINQRKVND